MFHGATAFHSRFSCPNGNHGPPVKCTCNSNNCPLTDSLFLTQIQACLEASPVDGLCSDSLSKYGSLPDWDVSDVTNMSHAFRDLASFDADLSNWDVSQVTDMEYMFHGASSFSSDISSWDTSRVINMRTCFTALPLSLLIFLPGTPLELPTCDTCFTARRLFVRQSRTGRVRLQPLGSRTCFRTLRLLFLDFYAETLRVVQRQRVVCVLRLRL